MSVNNTYIQDIKSNTRLDNPNIPIITIGCIKLTDKEQRTFVDFFTPIISELQNLQGLIYQKRQDNYCNRKIFGTFCFY